MKKAVMGLVICIILVSVSVSGCSSEKKVKCDLCKGSGNCFSCGGDGYFSGMYCSLCQGTGKCSLCNGKGYRVISSSSSKSSSSGSSGHSSSYAGDAYVNNHYYMDQVSDSKAKSLQRSPDTVSSETTAGDPIHGPNLED